MVSEIPIAASDGEIVSEFQLLVEKFDPILVAIGNSQSEVGMEPVREAIQSLQREIGNAKSLITSSGSRSAILTKQVDEMTQVLGRSLGLVLFAGFDLPVEIKEGIAVLHREVMHRKFATSLSSSPTHSHMSSSVANPSPKSSQESSAFINEFGSEIVEQGATLSTEDVALQLKYGDDEHFLLALLGLQNLIRDEVVDREWIDDEGILVILFNRLGSTKVGNRLATIQTMKSLALKYPEIKDRIGDAGNLQLLVKSLMRNVDECREAVGLLLELSKVSSVRRRIGKVQGCIVLLVATLNRDDPVASSDAAKLLESLSSNVQNALHMAEAGYFKALVHHLKEGSDMSKILMATSLSRMELTDQTRSSIGGDGAIEPLVKMFKTGKFEAKLSALNALHNLSRLEDNVHRLISSGIVVSLLQLLFSVTSVLMSLREPASAILATIAESESILVNQDVAQQMLSLLNLSSPVIQCHLLKALKNIASHSGASNVREKMKENGAIHLLLPFLTETNIHIRAAALNFLYTLSQDSAEDLMEHLGEYHLGNIINLISSSGSDTEKAVAIGILSNIPAGDKKATEILRKYNLLPILISLTSSSSGSEQLAESIAGVFIRFTMPSDKKLQLLAAELGLIPLLVKLLSSGSSVAKQRAATSLAQLSQNTLVLSRSRISKWKCMPPSGDAVCKVHDGICSIKRTFCLVKSGAIPPLIQILMEKGETEVGAVAAVLSCLATIVQDETWEKGSSCIAEMSGVQGIVRALECKDAKAQEKALWILERIFRNEAFRAEYGGSAQVMLIDLAQNGDPRLKSAIGKVLAQLELLQFQSSYF
ncbi:U-box domain-containing protein 43 [Linum perenne]